MNDTEATTTAAEPEKEDRALAGAKRIWADILADYRAYQAAEDGDDLTDEEGNPLDPEEEKERICEKIMNETYGVMVRDDWRAPNEQPDGPAEFAITLGGGGPSHRVYGMLSNGAAVDVEIQYQDWFTAWETFIPDGPDGEEYRDAMAWYAGFFSFD